MDEVSRGKGPISIEGLSLGGRKVVDPIHDPSGLIPGKAMFLHQMGNPFFSIGFGEENRPNSSGYERS